MGPTFIREVVHIEVYKRGMPIQGCMCDVSSSHLLLNEKIK